jgi:hypothetical protein
MEGFSFVTPVTGLSRPNTGKEDDDTIRRDFLALGSKRKTVLCPREKN